MPLTFLTLSALLLIPASPQTPSADAHAHHTGVDERGARVMGFDQQKTTHHFVLTGEGGRIDVAVNDPADATGVAQIRRHLQQLAPMFRAGNFESPLLIHARVPPGVESMKRAGSAIRYTYEELPGGGRLRLATSNAPARDAIHDFLRFQIADHRTGDPLEVRHP
jgi:hypothetical protein